MTKLQLLLYINMSIASDDGWEGYIWMGYCIEMVFYFLTAAAVPITYNLLCHTPIFHPNILLIFFTSMFSIYLFAVARIGLIYFESQHQLSCETIETCPLILIVFSFIRVFILGFVPNLLSLLLVERIVATICVATYEKKFYRFRFIAAILVLGIFSAFSAYRFTIESQPPRAEAGIMSVGISCIASLFIQIVIRINEKKEGKFYETNYSLSRRYQLTENIRSTQLLAYLLFFMTICNFLYVIAYLAHMLDISWKLRNVIGSMLNIFISCIFFIVSIFGNFVNHRIFLLWKGFARAKLRALLRLRRVGSEELSGQTSEMILDFRGRVLYTGAKQDDYFSQLDTQWA